VIVRAILPGRAGELISSVKGVGFVVVTAITLWGILATRDHLLARTERERAATPKPNFPTMPEAVFACVEAAFVATKLPRVNVDRGETATKADFHVQVR